jgi:ABC-2 type transport system ATP-binding protein
MIETRFTVLQGGTDGVDRAMRPDPPIETVQDLAPATRLEGVPADASPDAAITTDGLSRAFGEQPALDGLTIEVRPGEVLALLGPNGAGKTTTIRLLNGVLTPDSGRACVLGLDPTADGDALRHRTGVLTENAGLDDRLTARENLVFTARARGLSAGEADDRVRMMLDRFAMKDRADDQTIGFSTGQRKRLALVRALLHDPEVLYLDEPTSGLDPAATREVVALIDRLAREDGRTVVLCTHFLGEAGRLADSMAVLHHGRLQAFGRPEDLAAELWTGLEVDLDLGRRAPADVLDLLGSVPGVGSVAPSDQGAVVTVGDRSHLPGVSRALVAADVDVFATRPRAPTLEDIYFAIDARAASSSPPAEAPSESATEVAGEVADGVVA